MTAAGKKRKNVTDRAVDTTVRPKHRRARFPETRCQSVYDESRDPLAWPWEHTPEPEQTPYGKSFGKPRGDAAVRRYFEHREAVKKLRGT